MNRLQVDLCSPKLSAALPQRRQRSLSQDFSSSPFPFLSFEVSKEGVWKETAFNGREVFHVAVRPKGCTTCLELTVAVPEEGSEAERAKMALSQVHVFIMWALDVSGSATASNKDEALVRFVDPLYQERVVIPFTTRREGGAVSLSPCYTLAMKKAFEASRNEGKEQGQHAVLKKPRSYKLEAGIVDAADRKSVV